MANSSISIIDTKEFRGIVAPSKLLTKELLEDVIDFIELSSPEVSAEAKARKEEADRDNSWVSAKEVEKKLGL